MWFRKAASGNKMRRDFFNLLFYFQQQQQYKNDNFELCLSLTTTFLEHNNTLERLMWVSKWEMQIFGEHDDDGQQVNPLLGPV